jgi:hypothetical protein
VSGQGDIAIVLLVLGPDLTARQWSERLGLSADTIAEMAAAEGVRLAPSLAEPAPLGGGDCDGIPEYVRPEDRRNGRPPTFAPFEDRQIAAKRAAGQSFEEIARERGVHSSTIRRAVIRGATSIRGEAA